MKSLLIGFAILISSQGASAAPGLDSIQMQRLIESSQAQLKVARELLAQANRDSASLERAAVAIDQLTKGLEQQIQPLQGTKVYDRALLKLQEDLDGATQAGSTPQPGETEQQARARENFYQFQQQSHRASVEDITNHDQIAQALGKAQPGFVPKLQAQAELGQWQTNVRISAQLTELLASIQGLRKDLRNGRTGQGPEGFGLFLSGSAEQAKKLNQGARRVP